GNLSVSVALMPVGGTAGAVVTGTRWSNTLNDYLKVEPANRLRILAEDTLKEIGIAKDLVRRFIDQPRFTPRQDVMIALALPEIGRPPRSVPGDRLRQTGGLADGDGVTDRAKASRRARHPPRRAGRPAHRDRRLDGGRGTGSDARVQPPGGRHSRAAAVRRLD